MATTTFYAVLEIPVGSSSLDVKKAYRKLALKHHPDRNGGSAEATAKFKEISEAFSVLSDDQQRAAYDRTLRGGGSGARDAFREQQQQQRRGRGPDGGGVPHDPFNLFNDLFRHDPFFSEAFKDMDDAFARTFHQRHGDAPAPRGPRGQQGQQGMGWCAWVCSLLGINFQMTTMTSDGHGGFNTSSVSSTPRGNRGGPGMGALGRATYTSRSTHTVVENGQRVTVQSMERDGNQIEDRYVDGTLVDRRINGQAVAHLRDEQPAGRIGY